MKYFKFLLFLLISSSAFSQQKEVVADEFTHFQLTVQKDTIDFIVADTNFSVKKPVLLYCQGSQPVPLFFDIPDYGIAPVAFSNFDLVEMKKQYHVVVISMPKTPLVAGFDHLNKSYCYVEDTAYEHSYSVEHLKADYLENYVRRGNAVIKYLLKQKWVNAQRLALVGQSQGSKVALSIAASNKKVTQLGLFGFNPLGRIDQMVRQARKDAEQGKITWAEADSIQQHYYDFYKEIHSEAALKSDPGLISWKTFSTNSIDKLLQLEIPVYIAYGSEDIIADFCDLIPLFFIEKHKTNLTIKRYASLEHNFFPVKDGVVDYQNGEWKAVMNAFIAWSLK